MREGEVRVGAATAIAHMANKDHVREAMCQHAVESRELRLPFVFERLSARARDRVFASQIGHRKGFERSEEHTSELQSLMRNSYAVFCLKKKNKTTTLRIIILQHIHTNST